MPAFIKRVRALLFNLGALLLLLDLLLLIYGVFARYLLGSAPIWLDEMARYLIIGSVMLVLGALWVEGGHMRINLLEERLPAHLAQGRAVRSRARRGGDLAGDDRPQYRDRPAARAPAAPARAGRTDRGDAGRR